MSTNDTEIGLMTEETTVREQGVMWSLSIRYDGGDANEHQIDLNQLGESLQGLARILAVSAHFAQTGKYNKQFGALSVQVVAAPTQEHHCYEVLAYIKDIAMQPEIWSGFAGVVFTAVVGVVLSRGRREEMKLLNEALQKSLAQNQEMQTRVLETVDKMIDALQTSARRAHAPVGASVESISLRGQDKDDSSVVVLDRETKALVSAAHDTTIDDSRTYTGVISELDMISGTCRVALDSATPDERLPAVVTDPSVQRPSNAYVSAMATLSPIKFVAKAELDANGSIVRLHISDVAR